MTVFDWVRSWFSSAPVAPPSPIPEPRSSEPAGEQSAERYSEPASSRPPQKKPPKSKQKPIARRDRPRRVPVKLNRLRRLAHRTRQRLDDCTVPERPYAFARPGVMGGYLDLSRDGRDDRLRQRGLPQFSTPQELARWLQIPLVQLGWLVHRFQEQQRPADLGSSHYYYQWLAKRTGGERLLEIPKRRLRDAQERILLEILNRVPVHAAAHGFTVGRSIKTNAKPHVGQRVLLKFDLENFYPSVRFNRVVAIFRGLGYSREAAIWLGRLTTTCIPVLTPDPASPGRWLPYSIRHLPQGACTSPALANLSAYSLDLRLSGLARKFNAHYTRYADDITFSGDDVFRKSLAVFIPLVQQIIRHEQFVVNKKKRRVVRNNQRQSVTGVVVNEKANVSRVAYDRLKATLTNCVRLGPAAQNREAHADFAAHLRGRVAHVTLLNRHRGEKLLALYMQIDWSR